MADSKYNDILQVLLSGDSIDRDAVAQAIDDLLVWDNRPWLPSWAAKWLERKDKLIATQLVDLVITIAEEAKQQ